MRHRKSGRKLNMKSSHRKAMFRNMTASLIKHEVIKTTLPKAKELKVFIEPLITFAKKEAILRQSSDIESPEVKGQIVHYRRMVFNRIRNKDAVRKLFEEIAPRFVKRPGGYTKVLKCGNRFGDAAPMAYIELLDREIVESE